VNNSGQLKQEIRGTGIGLKNVKERLKLLFGEMASLNISNTNEQMVSAVLIIPELNTIGLEEMTRNRV